MRGLAEAAARHRVHMKAVRETGSEVVVGVGGIADTGNEQHDRARAAEIQVVNAHTALHADEPRAVRRAIDPAVVAGKAGWNALRLTDTRAAAQHHRGYEVLHKAPNPVSTS